MIARLGIYFRKSSQRKKRIK